MQAVDDVGFEVDEGEVFGLLGPNGAGKTTTLECLIGLRHPDAGEVEICGVDARKYPNDAKRNVGAALQTTTLQDKLTPREALSLFAALYGAIPRTKELLDRFGLAEKADAPFDSLSNGQRQRLALALTLVNEPAVIVLDEPTAGLDPLSRRELHGTIGRMRSERRTVLLSTHLLDEAAALCDRLAIINKGRVVAAGSPAELIARSRTTNVVVMTTSRAISHDLFAVIPGVDDLEVNGTQIRFRTADAARTLAAVANTVASHDIEILELHVNKGSLDDLFIDLTQT